MLINPPVDFSTVTYLSLNHAEVDIELMNELLSKCSNITNITIYNGTLDSLPNFSLCPHLRSIMISAPIKKVGNAFNNLPELQSFLVSNWWVEDFSFLQELRTGITNLRITNNNSRWFNLPDISRWKNLTTLWLDKCGDEKLRLETVHLPVLFNLSFTNCSFKNLPQSLSGCPNLQSITISNSQEIDIREYWEKLPNLNLLNISLTPIKGFFDLPETEVNWVNLYLTNNSLTFDKLDFLDKMPKLKMMSLHGNKITSHLPLLQKNIAPLQHWPAMPKQFKFKDLKVFKSITAAIAKSKLSKVDQDFFINFLVTKTKLSVNKRWDWPTILKATNISHLNFRKKLKTLIEEKIASSKEERDWSNAVIYVTGKLKMKVTDLKKQVEELGAEYVKNYSDKVNHVVIGMNSLDADLLTNKQFLPILETEIQQQYAETQPQFLKETAAEVGGAEMMENLGKLLTSSDVANVKIGVEMIKSGGMPPGLFEELLVVQKTTADAKIRKVVQGLLEIEAPLEWKPFIRDRLSFKMVHAKKPESDIRRQIKAVAKRITPTMAAKFSIMLYQHTGRGLRYALTARLAKGIKEEAYQLLLKDNHFDFSRGLGMTPLANRAQDYYSLPSSSVKLPVLATKLGTIYSLNLHNCGYHAVNQEIIEFKDLKHLDFSDNELTSIPDYFAELTNLETVDLRNHLFREFPAVLTKMTHLKKIDLRISRVDYRYGVMEIPEDFKKANPDCAVFV